MVVGGVVLLGIGLGIGILMGGEDSDPSSEISQIIEKKENPDADGDDENKEDEEELAEDCAEEEKDEEGNCPSGPKKCLKLLLKKKYLLRLTMNFQETLQQI